MDFLPTPQSPQYRITLFYGPEPVDGRPQVQQCVFNVKKRSWKAGVQVAVEIAAPQLQRATIALSFRDWLTKALASLAEEEQASYARRAEELLVQALAAVKLDVAIESGLSQENGRLTSDVLVDELDRRIRTSREQIRSQILTELDVPTS